MDLEVERRLVEVCARRCELRRLAALDLLAAQVEFLRGMLQRKSPDVLIPAVCDAIEDCSMLILAPNPTARKRDLCYGPRRMRGICVTTRAGCAGFALRPAPDAVD